MLFLMMYQALLSDFSLVEERPGLRLATWHPL
jgi:hypothetical protein